MLLGSLAYVKQITQVMLQLAKLMRRVAQYSPAEHDSAVVLLQVGEIASWAHVATANPHSAFYLDGDSQTWPREVESPAALRVESILALGRGETKLAGDSRDSGEGH